MSEQLDVKVYPNPTNGVLNIVGMVTGEVVVYNSLAQMVYTESIQSNAEVLDLSELKAGVYILQVRTENAVAVRRIRVLR